VIDLEEPEMRAFVIRDFEKPGAVEQVDAPHAGQNEVLIRVHTAGVNPMDNAVATGATRAWAETRVPTIPGIDAAGTVEAVGPDVHGFAAGDAVIANAFDKGFWGEGTFAELVVVPAKAVFAKPAGLDDVQAATVGLPGLTALSGIDVLDIKKGSNVVVIGATGGVGSWFTQLAADRGANVIGVARAENAEYARTFGCNDVVISDAAVVDELRAKFPHGVDAIADFSGNTELIDSLAALLKSGGKLGTSAARLDADAYAARGITAVQINAAPVERMAELLDLLASGRIKTPTAKVVPLEKAGDAVSGVGERHTRGKVVVRVSE
jgi:NADPH:quinone reductase-like Zn-dependent oxidoreductase